MATMSATMKQFTKGLKTTFEPMQTSLSNIEHALTITATREQEVETKRADAEKLEEEKKQTTWLKKLFGKKDEKGEGGGFFTKHWGKILTALAGLLLFLPKDFLKEKLFNPQWWKENATKIGGWIAGAFLAKKTWDLAAGTFGFALKAWMLKNMVGGGKGGFISRMFGFGGGDGGTTKKGVKGGKGGRMLPVLSKLGKIVGWAWAAGSLLNAQETFSEEGFSAGMGKFWETMWAGMLGDKKQVENLLNTVGDKIKNMAGEITKTFVWLASKDFKHEAKMLWMKIKNNWKKIVDSQKEWGGAPVHDKAGAIAAKEELLAKSSLTPTEQKRMKKLNAFLGIKQPGATEMVTDVLGAPGVDGGHGKETPNKQYLENLKKQKTKSTTGQGPYWDSQGVYRNQWGHVMPKSQWPVETVGKGSWTTGQFVSPKELERRATLAFLERNPMMTKDNLVNMVNFGTHKTRGTRESSWTELNTHAQWKTNLLASIFGGMNMTSGYRDYKTNRAAMIAKDNLNVYKMAWGQHMGPDGTMIGLTKKERNTIPGSKARENAVDKLLSMPDFGKGHIHGNAIDMRYPPGFGGEEGFPTVKRLIEGVLPGAKVLMERNAGGGSHLHIEFDPKNNPEAIRTAWNTAHTENREANLQLMGGGGGGGQAVINNAPTNIKQGDSTVLAGSYNAQDNGIWNEQVASSNRWRYG